MSAAIREEVKRVLREKFSWSDADADPALRRIGQCARVVKPETAVREASDPDDDRILECALAAQAQFIVSGDRDLQRLRRFQGIPILSPRQFIELRRWLRSE